MKTVCKLNQCVGCMACLEACGKKAITIQDSLRSYNAVIDEKKCIQCGKCYGVCQNNRRVETKPPVSWFQGWACSEEIRKHSSSGGFAAGLENQFVENDGIVCSCVFKGGKFQFEFSESLEKNAGFTGSKYVKSNPEGIYKKIRMYLMEGRKVLFVGLPCQVGGLKCFLPEDCQENLYTVDLICHGTPSPRHLEQFLLEYGYSINEIKEVSFRKKGSFNIEQNKKLLVPEGTYDKYTLAFLNALNYTENCYNCQYAKMERVSDITLGDSWGSRLEEKERKMGISLALCQTEKGEKLLKASKLYLTDVDLENAVRHNLQLEKPSEKPYQYDMFFKRLEDGENYQRAVQKALPRTCFNQQIKGILMKVCPYMRKKWNKNTNGGGGI